MAILENDSIIVDAILTDEGRRRLSEGIFEIAKFSLHDDEIVYSKAQQTNAASKFQTTPIFEATTDNVKALKYKLLTLTPDASTKKGEYTHLNVTRLVTQKGAQNGTPQATGNNEGYYVIISTEETYNDHYQGASSVDVPSGFLPGYSKIEISKKEDSAIKVDHGINDDGTQSPLSYQDTLPIELEETEFRVKLDHRLGRLATAGGGELRPNFIDEDSIATYMITTEMEKNSENFFTEVISKSSQAGSPILGARGPRLKLYVFAAPEINTSSDGVWDALGRNITSFFTNGTTTAKAIDAAMIVEGETTNVNITIPLRFVKNA